MAPWKRDGTVGRRMGLLRPRLSGSGRAIPQTRTTPESVQLQGGPMRQIRSGTATFEGRVGPIVRHGTCLGGWRLMSEIAGAAVMTYRSKVCVYALAFVWAQMLPNALEQLPPASAPQAPASPASVERAAKVLAEARQAMGGAKLEAITSILTTGRTRRVRGENLVPIEFEIRDRAARQVRAQGRDAGRGERAHVHRLRRTRGDSVSAGARGQDGRADDARRARRRASACRRASRRSARARWQAGRAAERRQASAGRQATVGCEAAVGVKPPSE